MDLSAAPPPIERPKLAYLLWVRDLTHDAVAPVFGVTRQQVWRYCLPFNEAKRAVPGPEPLERMLTWFRGELALEDFFPPHLRSPKPADEDYARKSFLETEGAA